MKEKLLALVLISGIAEGMQTVDVISYQSRNGTPQAVIINSQNCVFVRNKINEFIQNLNQLQQNAFDAKTGRVFNMLSTTNRYLNASLNEYLKSPFVGTMGIIHAMVNLNSLTDEFPNDLNAQEAKITCENFINALELK